MEQPFGKRLLIVTKKIRKGISEKLPKEIETDFPVLVTLFKTEQPLKQNEIASNCYYDTPTIVKVIDKFEKLGFVERKKIPEDRRANIVSLTEKGKKLFPLILQAVTEIHEKVFQNFSPEEKITFLQSFEKIEENLKDLQAQPPKSKEN
ncbi:MarR family transcriptional regulator [bacterium]|nr:MarR family transcriptional regulator [bacterium]